MIFTIDRLQFFKNDLIVFEFIDLEDKRLHKDGKNYSFWKSKIDYFKRMPKIKYYQIQYCFPKNIYKVDIFGENDFHNKEKIWSHTFTKDKYDEWFIHLNNVSGAKNNSSKELGAATDHLGDPFVQKLLNDIYAETDYEKTDFSNDDNGIRLVQRSLNGRSTFGFDFDLFETNQHLVIEFLKRDNNYVTNKTAHPNRYTKNFQKFVSLWNATQLLKTTSEPNLFLVNYSDQQKEEITLIKVVDFNEQATSDSIMITSDIGYLFKNYAEFNDWMRLLNTAPSIALEELEKYPKQIRKPSFWQGFDGPNKAKIKKEIGRQYC